jgi:hypothetical protein
MRTRTKKEYSVKRIAVLGLYNSGSTAIAGVLHRLGVNMGPPFWRSSDDNDPNNFYESVDLSWHLRRWWNEPELIEKTTAADRIRFLKLWIELQECAHPGPSGAKHPLLSLCGDDLIAAWGPETQFIWTWRPREQSIAGLQRRGWFPGAEESLQQRLWTSLHDFESRQANVFKLDWTQAQSDPEGVARQLATLLNLDRSEEQLQTASRFIRAVA